MLVSDSRVWEAVESSGHNSSFLLTIFAKNVTADKCVVPPIRVESPSSSSSSSSTYNRRFETLADEPSVRAITAALINRTIAV